MDHSKAIIATDYDLLVAKLNTVRLSIIDTMVDERLLQGLMIATQDNDEGLVLNDKLSEIKAARELLEKKARILRGMIENGQSNKDTLHATVASKPVA